MRLSRGFVFAGADEAGERVTNRLVPSGLAIDDRIAFDIVGDGDRQLEGAQRVIDCLTVEHECRGRERGKECRSGGGRGCSIRLFPFGQFFGVEIPLNIKSLPT